MLAASVIIWLVKFDPIWAFWLSAKIESLEYMEMQTKNMQY
uniref:Uncharacterized protein n=1 Tax=Anguilla anguilla TaxID=7936 RepID=A0A0E9PFB1_ANGAN